MQEYRIGDFARHMSVSTDTLKHYEKYGLIQFRHDELNGYRFCDFGQCLNILNVLGSRTAGATLRDNGNYVGLDESSATLSNSLAGVCESLERKITLYRHSIRYAQDCIAILDDHTMPTGAFNWRSTGTETGFYFFPFAVYDRFIEKTPPQSEEFGIWSACSPVARPAVCRSFDDAAQPVCGLMMPDHFVHEYDLPHAYATRVEGRFLSCDVVVRDEEAEDCAVESFLLGTSAVNPVLDFARRHNVAYEALYMEHMFVSTRDGSVLSYDRAHLKLA